MQAWESVQKTLKWLEENLSERIEIGELAEMANLSQFYYQRLFKRLVGRPVMEYVKLRRLAKAADYLAVNQRRIIDVALESGFENHETFTRSFKETYKITPEEYRAVPRPLSHFLMPDLLLNYYLVDENVPLIADGIILEVRRTILENQRYFNGLTVQNPMADTPGIDLLGELWNSFHNQKQKIDKLITNGNEAGVSYAGEEEGCFTYFSGAEVTDNKIQQGFKQWLMPEGNYVVCSFEAENFYLLTTNALNKARDYMFGMWLPNHKVTVAPFMAEIYYETAPEASMMEIWFRTQDDGGLVC